MDEIDEKLRDVYQALERLEARLILKIEKSENRSSDSITDKLNSLKDLVNASTTARHETITTEVSRMQKGNQDCSGRCHATVRGFETRLQLLENFRIGVDNFMNSVPSTIRTLVDDVATLKDWKALNWQRTIVYTGVAIIAVIKVFDWLRKAFPSVVS